MRFTALYSKKLSVAVLSGLLSVHVSSIASAQQSPSMRLIGSGGKQISSQNPNGSELKSSPKPLEIFKFGLIEETETEPVPREPTTPFVKREQPAPIRAVPLEPTVKGPLEAPRFVSLQNGEINETTMQESEESADGTLTPLQNRALTVEVLRVNIAQGEIGTGRLPESVDKPTTDPSFLPDGLARGVMRKQVNWQPTNIAYNPLYFEDAMLERHGHVRFGCLQPLASGAKFFTTIPLLPYLHTLKPKHSCQYALGHYRPGTCAPLLKDHLPYDRNAAAVELSAVAGFFWAAPL